MRTVHQQPKRCDCLLYTIPSSRTCRRLGRSQQPAAVSSIFSSEGRPGRQKRAVWKLRHPGIPTRQAHTKAALAPSTATLPIGSGNRSQKPLWRHQRASSHANSLHTILWANPCRQMPRSCKVKPLTMRLRSPRPQLLPLLLHFPPHFPRQFHPGQTARHLATLRTQSSHWRKCQGVPLSRFPQWDSGPAKRGPCFVIRSLRQCPL